jgi:hypothetical protein
MGHPATDGRHRHDLARMLWTELLARLTHVAEVFARQEAAAQLKGLGVRSADTALASLAREYARASQIALTTGAAPLPHEVMQRALSFSGQQDLQRDFLELAEGYRQLMRALALPQNCQRQRWLHGRALVHVAQANAFARA